MRAKYPFALPYPQCISPGFLKSRPRTRVYREDLAIHAARMKADPERTRDLMGRHRAMSEGIVNNLMNHQGVRDAHWKGLALARLQVGLAIVMLNVLKWYKIKHSAPAIASCTE